MTEDQSFPGRRVSAPGLLTQLDLFFRGKQRDGQNVAQIEPKHEIRFTRGAPGPAVNRRTGTGGLGSLERALSLSKGRWGDQNRVLHQLGQLGTWLGRPRSFLPPAL